MWWLEAAPGGMPSAILALLLTALSLMPFEGLARKTSTGNSEFIGCLDGSLSLLAGSHQIKKEAAEKSYYDCSAACVETGAYPYSYFTDLGKGVQKCYCSSIGPRPSDYVVQPVGSFGCQLGQTRAALTQTDHHFIICSSGFIGSFSRAGTYSSPLDCLDACGEDEGALFLPTYNGFSCRCGGVTSVKSIAACGAPNAEFSYVYKPAKSPKASKSKASFGTGRKKLGKGSKNRLDSQEGVKKYDNPCDDPDSILGYCGFGEEDNPVFHDRTLA
ncbi:hypothetical protein CNBB3560 [Cryptococcus deneoformans B-3501A]|uniref:Expressed protein n=1 Tax=Cryptococcus deneoformans (strain JEC21 / ATCC MYA-565) TaxID=214684 RepID=Q5KMC7_CRYD1|nr:expressed protein [Cryptococcus neoformans var. neoformans JEC21]XP_777124.1 hypothetical protein CNBB3560 [Cryptococcus neoformans var. neoformans B-3501A]AAW41701.1 expressed protein [Cryptococcus neoformans var. neoformans JEC21]EAL22477.1 hypothetical protein CNBB3560 [Cryptococcus neoformans var. neoformans B-3501A]